MSNPVTKRWATPKEKTDRAFRAYLDLLDAAEHMRGRVYGQLTTYGLTMRGFRLLELLHRKGPTLGMDVSRTFRWKRQNLDAIVKGLKCNGWVNARRLSLEDLEALGIEVPDGDGRPLSLLSLTKEGAAFAARFLPRHAKVVRAYMRSLDGRQQQTLSELCRKVRDGNVTKFISEMEHEDVED